jgi:hypothetical protein
VNSTIVAALIAGGATAVVAVASFLTTRSMTLRQLAAARQSRLWDKQAATYADALTAIRWRQVRRRLELLTVVNRGRSLPEEKPPVNWEELQGRLFAFASPEVLVALKAAGDAGILAEGFLLELGGQIRKAIDFVVDSRLSEALHGDYDFDPEADSSDEIKPLIAKAQRAIQSANDKDDALIDVIRADLQGDEGRARRHRASASRSR